MGRELFGEAVVRRAGRGRWAAGSRVGPSLSVEGSTQHEAGVGVRRWEGGAVTFAWEEGLPARWAAEDVVLEVGEVEVRALVRRAIDAARGVSAAVRRVEGHWQERAQRVWIETDGQDARQDVRRQAQLRVDVVWGGEGQRAVGYALVGREGLFDDGPERAAAEAVRRAQERAHAQPFEGGVMPVVLAAGWGGAWLHEAAGHALEADLVRGGTSPFAGRFGERVAPPHVTLVDDPARPAGRGSFRVDDEGTPAAPLTLVEGGVLRAFLADQAHAEALGLARAGRARRAGFRHAPLPRMTNLVLAAGDADPDALVADVREGLYVEALGRGAVWPRADRYAVEVLGGYRIERGRRSSPVAGVWLEGHSADALHAVVGVGWDERLDGARGLCGKAGQVVPVSAGAPTLLLSASHLQVLPSSMIS